MCGENIQVITLSGPWEGRGGGGSIALLTYGKKEN